MAISDLEKTRLVLEDGSELTQWSDYAISADFLTPSDSFSLTVGGEKSWIASIASLQPGYRIQAYVDGVLVLTGFIDSVTVESSTSSGLSIGVQGRDILSPIIKSNIYPSFSVKNLTVTQMVERVLKDYYRKEIPTVYADDSANRKVLGLVGAYSPRDRSTRQKAVIERAQAHPNEGAFEFVSRNLRRHGLWMWATAEGNIVVSGPDYNQEPAYNIVRKRGNGQVLYPSARLTADRTNTPSYLSVNGKSSSQEWEKSKTFGYVVDSAARNHWHVEPAYIQHDEATTMEQANAFAAQEMTRLRERSKVYSVTAIGHRDRLTGQLFAVNTIANVDDDILGVRNKFWVSSRVFRKSFSGGTTTDLELLPLGAIQISETDLA